MIVVAAVAAVASCEHAYDLVRTHDQVGWTVRQVPLTVDVAKGTRATINGQHVYTLTDKAKDTTMYVSDTSTPQIIKVVGKQNGNSEEFTITYGVPKSITAPPASETAVLPSFGS